MTDRSARAVAVVITTSSSRAPVWDAPVKSLRSRQCPGRVMIWYHRRQAPARPTGHHPAGSTRTCCADTLDRGTESVLPKVRPTRHHGHMAPYADYCPIAVGVEVLGDRWTPLVIR